MSTGEKVFSAPVLFATFLKFAKTQYQARIFRIFVWYHIMYMLLKVFLQDFGYSLFLIDETDVYPNANTTTASS